MNHSHSRLRWIPLALSCALSCTLPSRGGDPWPQWRGPAGDGSTDARNLPLTWSLETGENIVWKTELPSWSGSTPIIWGDRIFLMSPSKPEAGNAAVNLPASGTMVFGQQAPPQQPAGGAGQGRSRGGGGGRGFGGGGFGRGVSNPGGQTLLLLCLSKKDGSLLWQGELDQGNRLWNKGNNTSPSPVTDGKHVWAVTGNGVITAFDMEGKEVWTKSLQKEYGAFGHNWGYGCSPLLVDGKLVVEVLHGMRTDDPSYVVAFDALSGKELWRQERPTDAPRESPDAYTTPALLVHEGKKQVVITGADYVTGHDLDTGKELWRAAGLNPRKASNYRIVPSPVVKDGMIYAPTRIQPLLALRAGGVGDITTSHLAWKSEDGNGPDVPTPVCDGKFFYMVNDRGLVTCLDAKTGQRVYGPQGTADGTVSASPLLAGDRIYILNEQAVTTVIAAGPEFKVLATNKLDGSYTLSSFAVSGDQLFVRTSTHLYCLGKKAS